MPKGLPNLSHLWLDEDHPVCIHRVGYLVCPGMFESRNFYMEWVMEGGEGYADTANKDSIKHYMENSTSREIRVSLSPIDSII